MARPARPDASSSADVARARILVFAKVPVAGAVKTRLEPRIGSVNAARLHAAFLEDVVASARQVAEVVLYHDPGEPGPVLASLGIELKPQQGSHLGERMANAIGAEIRAGVEKVLVLGSDSPDLPRSRLLAAVAALEGAPVVIGPAVDGGYYLVGVRGLPPEALFRDIPFGGREVLAATLAAVRAASLDVALLEPWYDIDRPEDLDFLRTHLEFLSVAGGEERCPATRRVLASLP